MKIESNGTKAQSKNRVVEILPIDDSELATIEGGRDYWGWERKEMGTILAFKSIEITDVQIG